MSLDTNTFVITSISCEQKTIGDKALSSDDDFVLTSATETKLINIHKISLPTQPNFRNFRLVLESGKKYSIISFYTGTNTNFIGAPERILSLFLSGSAKVSNYDEVLAFIASRIFYDENKRKIGDRIKLINECVKKSTKIMQYSPLYDYLELNLDKKLGLFTSEITKANLIKLRTLHFVIKNNKKMINNLTIKPAITAYANSAAKIRLAKDHQLEIKTLINKLESAQIKQFEGVKTNYTGTEDEKDLLINKQGMAISELKSDTKIIIGKLMDEINSLDEEIKEISEGTEGLIDELNSGMRDKIAKIMELEEELMKLKAGVPISSTKQNEIYHRALAKSDTSNKTPMSKTEIHTRIKKTKEHHIEIKTLINKLENAQTNQLKGVKTNDTGTEKDLVINKLNDAIFELKSDTKAIVGKLMDEINSLDEEIKEISEGTEGLIEELNQGLTKKIEQVLNLEGEISNLKSEVASYTPTQEMYRRELAKMGKNINNQAISPTMSKAEINTRIKETTEQHGQTKQLIENMANQINQLEGVKTNYTGTEDEKDLIIKKQEVVITDLQSDTKKILGTLMNQIVALEEDIKEITEGTDGLIDELNSGMRDKIAKIMVLEEELTALKAKVPVSSAHQKEIYQRALEKSAQRSPNIKISNKTQFSTVSKPVQKESISDLRDVFDQELKRSGQKGVHTSSVSPETHHKRLIAVFKKHVSRQIKVDISALEKIIDYSIKEEGIVAENFFKKQPSDQFNNSLNVYRKIYDKLMVDLGYNDEIKTQRGIKSAISRHKTDLRVFESVSLKFMFDKEKKTEPIKPEPNISPIISTAKDDIYLKRFITYYKKFIGRYIKLDTETLRNILTESLNTWRDKEGKTLKDLSKMSNKDQFLESIKIYQNVFDGMKSDIWGLNRTEEIEKGLRMALAFQKTSERVYDTISIKLNSGIDKSNDFNNLTNEKEEETIEIIEKPKHTAYHKSNINLFKKFILRNLKIDVAELETIIGESLEIWQNIENKNPFEFSKMQPREKFDEAVKIYREIYKKSTQMGMYGSPEQVEKAIKSAISYHKTSERIYEAISISIS